MREVPHHIALELKNITKKFPGPMSMAVEDLSFKVKEGSIHGFLGPNGAGKSTTMNMIAGLIPPTSGKIEYFGQSEKVPLGLLPENPPLYHNMQVFEYLSFVAKIYGVKKSSVKTHLADALEKCGLSRVQKRAIGNLSKGFKQRVGIAQGIIHNPKIIILDEPTVGLDPNAIVEIRELILSLAKNHTILFSTHQLHEAQLLCSDISIINRGRLIETGSFQGLQRGLQAKTVLRVHIRFWDQGKEERLKEKFNILQLSTKRLVDRGRELGHEDGHGFSLEIGLGEDCDQRGEISEFLVANKCHLLNFSEVKLELEDIFKKLTGDFKEDTTFSAGDRAPINEVYQ